MPFGVEKLEWFGYRMVKNFKDMLIRFDRMYERDKQTNRQTPHVDIDRAYASHCTAKNRQTFATVLPETRLASFFYSQCNTVSN